MKKTRYRLFLATLTFALVNSEAMTGELGFGLTRSSIDGGGAMLCAGGDFELSGTVGQTDATTTILAGDDIELTGGFWFRVVLGDCNADGGINLFDLTRSDTCLSGPDGGPPPPPCACLDIDGDGDVDLSDFGEFQAAFSGT